DRGTREQPELPLAGLATASEKLQHRSRVSRVQPRALVHPYLSANAIVPTSPPPNCEWSRRPLRLFEQEVNHPTAAYAGPRPAEVPEEFGVRTLRLFQCVREHREPRSIQRAFRKRPLLVGGLCEPYDVAIVPGKPGTVDHDSAER